MSVGARCACSIVAMTAIAANLSGCFSLSGPKLDRPRYDYSQPLPEPSGTSSPASTTRSPPGPRAPGAAPAGNAAP